MVVERDHLFMSNYAFILLMSNVQLKGDSLTRIHLHFNDFLLWKLGYLKGFIEEKSKNAVDEEKRSVLFDYLKETSAVTTKYKVMNHVCVDKIVCNQSISNPTTFCVEVVDH